MCDNIEAAIKEADIINLATRSNKGLFERDQTQPNVHINAVGSYQPSMKEVSDSVIAASAYIFIDDEKGGRQEAGDLIQAHDNQDCAWTWDKLSGKLADLVNGNKTVDTNNDKGVTVFKSVGTASFDAAVALRVAKQAIDQSLGTHVEL